jgi:hypothetical protein
MRALSGFGKPYDFRKILPFLAGLFLSLFAATGHLVLVRLACFCQCP